MSEETQVDLLRREVELYKKEIRHLTAKLKLVTDIAKAASFTPADSSKSSTYGFTLQGIEEMVLKVKDGRVIYANHKMAAYLGWQRDELKGAKLEVLDRLPWAEGLFTTILFEAEAKGGPVEFEKNWRDPVRGETVHLRFIAATKKGEGEIVIRDESRFHRLRDNFARYVSPRVIEKMACGEEDFFRTERREVSVLFADLRGFTPASAALEPEAVTAQLNEYLAAALEVVDRYEGTVDKIVGDEVMVLFNAPHLLADHAPRAVAAALEMLKAHAAVQDRWRRDNRTPLSLGVGVNTGPAVIGNIGSDVRVNYTAIGHTVNVASRLCANAKGGEVLVGGGTKEALDEYARTSEQERLFTFRLKAAGKIQVKGLIQPMEVFTVKT